MAGGGGALANMSFPFGGGGGGATDDFLDEMAGGGGIDRPEVAPGGGGGGTTDISFHSPLWVEEVGRWYRFQQTFHYLLQAGRWAVDTTSSTHWCRWWNTCADVGPFELPMVVHMYFCCSI